MIQQLLITIIFIALEAVQDLQLTQAHSLGLEILCHYRQMPDWRAFHSSPLKSQLGSFVCASQAFVLVRNRSCQSKYQLKLMGKLQAFCKLSSSPSKISDEKENYYLRKCFGRLSSQHETNVCSLVFDGSQNYLCLVGLYFA